MKLLHAALGLAFMVLGLGVVNTNRSRALSAEQQVRTVLAQMQTQEASATSQLTALRAKLAHTQTLVATERKQRHKAELTADKAEVQTKIAVAHKGEALRGKLAAQKLAAELRAGIAQARKVAEEAKAAATAAIAKVIVPRAENKDAAQRQPVVAAAASPSVPTAQPHAQAPDAELSASQALAIAAPAASDDGAWRTEAWFTKRQYCDGYLSPLFKTAAAAVKTGDKSPAALARWLYPMFSEHSAGVGRIEDLVHKMHVFFEKHGLHYVLYAGSLIGALRHDGVIPYDTDADIQMPVDEFKILAGLEKEIKAEMGCTLRKADMSFIFMGNAAKIDIWPVYETRAEAMAPEAGGPPTDPLRPWVSVKYWRDDNIPKADILAATLHKFGASQAYIPNRAMHYVTRLYGKEVMQAVKVWNDDFNLQHCNNCNWSPNTYLVPISDFKATFQRFKADTQTKYGC